MDMIKNDPILDMYIFETSQLAEQLELLVIDGEKDRQFSNSINEIFRIMHTIKGSSAMMLFHNIANLSHAIEDLFFYIREKEPLNVDYHAISDILLDAVDFIKNELLKIDSGNPPDGDSTSKITKIHNFLNQLKEPGQPEDMKKPAESQNYKAIIFFDEGCEMENIRAYAVVHSLSEIATITKYIPENIIEDEECVVNHIRQNGFVLFFQSDVDKGVLHNKLENTIFLSKLEFSEVESIEETNEKTETCEKKKSISNHQNQGIISVNIGKTDQLMDLIGELVIAEAMVTQNPDLKNLHLENFQKAARQLQKITNELQEVAMSIRMVTLSPTFFKMNRIVRDMSNKMDKKVNLKIIGEETEVDKNVIEHISDPLMHLVRNAIDHGIESPQLRKEKGKSEEANLCLEAKNAGSDVLIIVKDDGKGLDKAKILEKAKSKGLLNKPDNEMSDKEIFNLIFLPGFSTSENVTEFSGRGVGMDVVTKNIEEVGGTIAVDSLEDRGTTITLKIPLTLAIIDGMNVRVGSSYFTVPISAIRESFRPNLGDIIKDSNQNEMIMLRGKSYPIIRIHKLFKVENTKQNFEEGILILLEQGGSSFCIFIDELLGQQQVVVKALPNYIKNVSNIEGLGGCTLLGDGNISLILDIAGLQNCY